MFKHVLTSLWSGRDLRARRRGECPLMAVGGRPNSYALVALSGDSAPLTTARHVAPRRAGGLHDGPCRTRHRRRICLRRQPRGGTGVDAVPWWLRAPQRVCLRTRRPAVRSRLGTDQNRAGKGGIRMGTGTVWRIVRDAGLPVGELPPAPKRIVHPIKAAAVVGVIAAWLLRGRLSTRFKADPSNACRRDPPQRSTTPYPLAHAIGAVTGRSASRGAGTDRAAG